MSKVGGGLSVHSGGLFTVIVNRLIVFKYILRDNLQFWGAQPPLSKSGGLKPPLPPCPPGSLPLT